MNAFVRARAGLLRLIAGGTSLRKRGLRGVNRSGGAPGEARFHRLSQMPSVIPMSILLSHSGINMLGALAYWSFHSQ
jgi:hypothetical protein